MLGNSDLTAESLNALKTLCLANAQECFFRKARGDNMKDETVAKIAAKAAELFKLASETYPGQKNEGPLMLSKSHYFGAMAEYLKSKGCVAAGKYGEEIARLRSADVLLKKVLDAAKHLPDALVNDAKVLRTHNKLILLSSS